VPGLGGSGESGVQEAEGDPRRLRHRLGDRVHPQFAGHRGVVEADDRAGPPRAGRRPIGAEGEGVGGADQGGRPARQERHRCGVPLVRPVRAVHGELRFLRGDRAHGPAPAIPPVAAHPGLERPRDVADPAVPGGGHPLRHRFGPGGAVDVHPVEGRVPRVGGEAPGPAEGHEGDAEPQQAGRAGVLVVGGREDHAVGRPCRGEPFIGGELVLLVGRGEQGEAIPVPAGLLGDLVEEGVEDVSVDPVERGHEPHREGVGARAAQLLGGVRGHVPGCPHGGEHPVEGGGGQPVGAVEGVRDRLAGDSEVCRQ